MLRRSYLSIWRKYFDVRSEVVNVDILDPFGITTFYGGRRYPAKTSTTVKFIIKGLNHKIIHVHSAYRFVKYFRRVYPFKGIVMHFHGEDVRLAGWNNLKSIIKPSNIVLASTPDLLEGAPDNVIYLPNSVDVEHFKPILSIRRKKQRFILLNICDSRILTGLKK